MTDPLSIMLSPIVMLLALLLVPLALFAPELRHMTHAYYWQDSEGCAPASRLGFVEISPTPRDEVSVAKWAEWTALGVREVSGSEALLRELRLEATDLETVFEAKNFHPTGGELSIDLARNADSESIVMKLCRADDCVARTISYPLTDAACIRSYQAYHVMIVEMHPPSGHPYSLGPSVPSSREWFDRYVASGTSSPR